MAEFALDVHDAEVRRDLERITLMLRDLRPLWPAVSRLAISWISRQFESQGSFFGDPWAPLSPEYAAWKTIHFPGKAILSAEGDLRRAATSPKRRVSAHTLVMEFGPYEKHGHEVSPVWFQEGTEKMPARPILFGDFLPGGARTELDAVVNSYVRDMLRRLRIRL